MRQLEDDILENLKNCDPKNILDNDDIINKLDSTKDESTRIKKYKEESDIRQATINHERNQYLDLAHRMTILFFVLVDFAKVN